MVRQGSSVGAWNAMPAIFTGCETTLAGDRDVPGIGKLQAGHELHQGGFAATGRPHHRGEFAAVDAKVRFSTATTLSGPAWMPP